MATKHLIMKPTKVPQHKSYIIIIKKIIRSVFSIHLIDYRNFAQYYYAFPQNKKIQITFLLKRQRKSFLCPVFFVSFETSISNCPSVFRRALSVQLELTV